MAAKKTVKKAPATKVEKVKEPAKAVAKAAPAKKAEAVKAETKAPAKKAVAKKAAAKKAAAASATTQYTPEQVYGMIQEAAYFAAVNDGFQKDPSVYWAQAEAEINAKVKA